MKQCFFALMVMSLVTGCNAQNNQNDMSKAQEKSTADTQKNQPQIHTRVNKKFDKNGNLIGYDSTYTSYYSNWKKDTLLADSVMSGFIPYFNKRFPGMMANPFDKMFFEDSLMQNDFFYDNFFNPENSTEYSIQWVAKC